MVCHDGKEELSTNINVPSEIYVKFVAIVGIIYMIQYS